MADRFSEHVLKFLSSAEYRPMRARRLAYAMDITATDYSDFRQTLATLLREGRITVGGGKIQRGGRARSGMVGVFRANPRGFGFVVPQPPEGRRGEEQPDVFIPPGASLGAQTGDTVVCRVTRRSRRDGKAAHSGEIIEIIT